MKKIVAATMLATASCAVCAADAVTIYGLIDLGITSYSSARTTTGSEARVTRMDSGIAQSSRLGFRGTEDLGGGISSFFTLETGYNPDDGSLGQGGTLFGRQAYLGLRDQKLGVVSLGRQYDFMANLGAAYAAGAQTAAGAMGWGVHADAAHNLALNNHIFAGDRTNNSIKYETENMGGARFGVMYGLGEVAGNINAGRTWSGLASYDRGPFSTAAAVVDIKNAAGSDSTRIYGAGASYQLEKLKPFGILTEVKNTGNGAKATTLELGAVYAFMPAWEFGGGLQYQRRNQGIGSARAVVAALDYKFSKRTDVYLSATYDRDRGYRAFPVFGGGVQSNDGVQSAIRVGIRHRF